MSRESAHNAETVRPGQVWADNDPRGGPTFKIVALQGDYAIVSDLNGYRQRKIQRKRIRPGKRGYRLIQDVEGAGSVEDQRLLAAAEFLSAFHGEVNDSQVMPPEDYIVDAIRLLAHIDGPIPDAKVKFWSCPKDHRPQRVEWDGPVAKCLICGEHSDGGAAGE